MKNAEIVVNEKYFTRVSGALILVIVTGREHDYKGRKKGWQIKRADGKGNGIMPRHASALHLTRNPLQEMTDRAAGVVIPPPRSKPCRCMSFTKACDTPAECGKCGGYFQKKPERLPCICGDAKPDQEERGVFCLNCGGEIKKHIALPASPLHCECKHSTPAKDETDNATNICVCGGWVK